MCTTNCALLKSVADDSAALFESVTSSFALLSVTESASSITENPNHTTFAGSDLQALLSKDRWGGGG
jgi:hypothetical protein